VTSEVGHGSSFIVRVPAEISEAAATGEGGSADAIAA
jgi:hypothetical protein